MIFSVLLLVAGLATGAVFFWDIRGLATAMRARLEDQPITGAWQPEPVR